jgi:hypothetical protein
MELILRDRRAWRPLDAIFRLATAAVGFLLVQGAWVGYLAATGVLDDFIDIQRHYTLPYQDLRWAPAGVSFYRHVLVATEGWLSNAWFITAPAFVGLIALLIRVPRQGGYIIGLLIAIALSTVWWQSKFFQYHWIIMMPFLAIPAGYLLHEGLNGLWGLTRTASAITAIAAAFFLGLMLLSPLLRTYDAYAYLIDRESGDITQEEIDRIYSPALRFNHELVDYVIANSNEDEAFVIWGTWPQALLWADRPSPTNFVTSPALRSEWAPDKWREEYVDDLKSDPPRFFAIADFDYQPWLTGTDFSSRADFCDHVPKLRGFIEAGYAPVFRNDLFVMYEYGAPEATVPGACP